jgi:cellulose synthase/poly-beta-1,6-N-acetylglucosamine synthase-like glycosyltransferase
MILEYIFWIFVGLIVYTLFLYPLLTLVLAVIINREVDKNDYIPVVSFIIAAYNEEECIADKIEQTLSLDYPADRLEIIVASDGSSDKTDEIVKSYADRGVKLCRVEGRKGKTHALNETVKTAIGEILVFSDATGKYNKQAVREMVANFHDPRIGCVAGRVAYNYGADATSEGFKGYQKCAVAIRRAETRFGSQTSVSGSIHAIRKKLYRTCPVAFSLDVIDAVHSVVQNHRVVYENNAVSLEESRQSMGEEFRARVRISVRAQSMIVYILRELILHRKWGYVFQMVSHKILRWMLWCWLIVAFCSNVLVLDQSSLYYWLFGFQCLLYTTALIGMLLGQMGLRIRGISSITLFFMANVAMACGALKAWGGKTMASWEPIR